MTRSRHRYSPQEAKPMAAHHLLRDLIEQFGEYQDSVGRASGTKTRYRFTFQLFLEFLIEEGRAQTSQAITTETMEAFARFLRATPTRQHKVGSQRKESGIHAHLRDMRAFTRWLQKRGIIQNVVDFPMPKIPKRLVRVLSDEEMERLWQSSYLTGDSGRSIRNRALIAFMLDTGVRREEAASIRLANLNLERRTVTVIGKGNKERRLYFSARVREILREFLAIRGIDDEPLFHLSAGGIRTTFRRIQLETGLDQFHPHMLRRQFATTLHKNGVRGEEISLLMGHEDFNTTRRYLSINDDDLQEAHEVASPFDTLVKGEAPPPAKRRVRYTSKAA